jgi:invasion protein IalB
MTRKLVACVAAFCSTAVAASMLDVPFKPGEEAVPDSHYPSVSGKLGEVTYRRYEDGSAGFRAQSEKQQDVSARDTSEWQVSCKLDAMSDEPSCIVSRGDIMVLFDRKCAPLVLIGHDHFPRTPSLIRIDRGSPSSTTDKYGAFNREKSRQLVAALKKGKSFTTRYQKWPYEAYEDIELDTKGFAEVSEYACWATRQLRGHASVAR